MLAGYIDVIDMVDIDNQTSTNANKIRTRLWQLLLDHLFDLPQLEGNHSYLTARHEQIAIIAIRGYIYNMCCRYTQQFVGSGYDEIGLQFEQITSIECKSSIFLRDVQMWRVKMYEIGRFVYELTTCGRQVVS